MSSLATESISAYIAESGELMVLDSASATFGVARVHNSQNRQQGMNCSVTQLSVVRGWNKSVPINQRGFTLLTGSDGREIKVLVSELAIHLCEICCQFANIHRLTGVISFTKKRITMENSIV